MRKNQEAFKLDKITLKQYLRVYSGVRIPWLFLVLIIVFQLVYTRFSVHVTNFTGDLVDASGNLPMDQLVTYAVTALLTGILACGSGFFVNLSSIAINRVVRQKLYGKLLYVPQSVYDENGAERLISAVTNDCENASYLFTQPISIVSTMVIFVIYVREMFGINSKLALWLLLVIPSATLLTWGVTKLRAKVIQKTQVMLANTTRYMVERTRNILLVKSCCAENMESSEAEAYFQSQYDAEMETGMVDVLWTVVSNIITLAGQLIPFAAGSIMVAKGTITVGDVVMMYTYGQIISIHYLNICNLFSVVIQSANGLTRVNRALEYPEEDLEEGVPVNDADGDICFENVDFSYGEKAVLKNIACTIPRGKVTVVIGPNGAGKSTLFKLVKRLYEPKCGTMLFGTHDAKKYNLQDWRRSIGIVAQDCPLIAGTIRENILYGCRRSVQEDELIQVAKKARVYDFVKELPNGFDTVIAPNGSNFSGGQQHCIAIARAMMSSPDYLLLDEATSNLDSSSEKAVTEALSELMEGRTTIVIAHTLNAIRNADYVIALRDGEIENAGAPEEILRVTDNYLSRMIHRGACKKNIGGVSL